MNYSQLVYDDHAVPSLKGTLRSYRDHLPPYGGCSLSGTNEMGNESLCEMRKAEGKTEQPAAALRSGTSESVPFSFKIESSELNMVPRD